MANALASGRVGQAYRLAGVGDAPRRVAEEQDVACLAFDGEVFVERADHGAIW